MARKVSRSSKRSKSTKRKAKVSKSSSSGKEKKKTLRIRTAASWMIQLTAAPTAVVSKRKCPTKDDALVHYKKLCGIVSSDHQFRIEDCDSDGLQLTKDGLVVGSLPSIKADQIETISGEEL